MNLRKKRPGRYALSAWGEMLWLSALHQFGYFLYLVRNPDPGRAVGEAGHVRAFPAPSGALPDSHVQFAQGPMVFSQEKVIVLSESRMNLRPVWAAASLAAVAGDGGELLFQAG